MVSPGVNTLFFLSIIKSYPVQLVSVLQYQTNNWWERQDNKHRTTGGRGGITNIRLVAAAG